MERIERLRKIALEKQGSLLKNPIYREDFIYYFFKNFGTDCDTSNVEKYANSFYEAFAKMRPNISDDELVVGKYGLFLNEEEKKEYNETYLDVWKKTAQKAGGGQDSHMSIDYDIILNLGIAGIIEKIDKYIETATDDKIPFYQSCKKCLDAVIVHSENYADEAKRLAESEKNEERKKELETISKICRKVPKYPAESFYEAVQSVSFITYCLGYNPYRYSILQFQLGHPDRYLYKYYKNDIENKVITKEFAHLLLDCVGIQINRNVAGGVSNGYMVGGRDENNEIVQNDLTKMCMQVIDDIRLVYPSVGFCYTEGMDDEYIEMACEILTHGRSHPAIFNDDVIIKGLKSYGVPEKEACSYIHSNCVEITPVASSNVWVASPYTNMAQLLLDVMDREYNSFDELIEKIYSVLDEKIKNNLEVEINQRNDRCNNSLNPLLSCFVNDCLERGLDIERGGARYNWIMPSFVGMANLVDSLYAIKELVFDKKEFTIKELKEIIDDDFKNNEVLRQRILNTIPKYGNDNDDVDKYFDLIIKHIVSECKKHEGVHSNANLIPSVFCWIRHESFGRQTGATPDGRRAGFPLGDGSGPCQGREMKGPTASIISSTKWEHHELIGGVAVNMKFSKKSLGPNSVETMKNLVKTYLSRGGFEIQINVVDKDTLLKAVDNPEQYRDLVVRIGGYSDYFVSLEPNMQQEVIARTEHSL
ncbi:MAG: hypothetical protein J6A69_04780 [Clostridia bacterium]|nr:hypothetical protein [Clostridia bacterium]